MQAGKAKVTDYSHLSATRPASDAATRAKMERLPSSQQTSEM